MELSYIYLNQFIWKLDMAFIVRTSSNGKSLNQIHKKGF